MVVSCNVERASKMGGVEGYGRWGLKRVGALTDSPWSSGGEATSFVTGV